MRWLEHPPTEKKPECREIGNECKSTDEMEPTCDPKEKIMNTSAKVQGGGRSSNPRQFHLEILGEVKTLVKTIESMCVEFDEASLIARTARPVSDLIGSINPLLRMIVENYLRHTVKEMDIAANEGEGRELKGSVLETLEEIREDLKRIHRKYDTAAKFNRDEETPDWVN